MEVCNIQKYIDPVPGKEARPPVGTVPRGAPCV